MVPLATSPKILPSPRPLEKKKIPLSSPPRTLSLVDDHPQRLQTAYVLREVSFRYIRFKARTVSVLDRNRLLNTADTTRTEISIRYGALLDSPDLYVDKIKINWVELVPREVHGPKEKQRKMKTERVEDLARKRFKSNQSHSIERSLSRPNAARLSTQVVLFLNCSFRKRQE